MASNKTKPDTSADYGADQITALEGLEPVRLRPGMYIGGTDTRGLHHLIWEIVDNSVDEALAGHCTEIKVELLKDNSIRVTDNGRGIPVGKNSKTGKHAVMMVFEELHAGGKFGDGGYKVSGGLHGVGASVTNALSRWLNVEVHREGHVWTAAWAQGKRTQDLKKGGKSDKTGTIVTWLFDDTIFNKGVAYNPSTIEQRLREKSYLVRGLKFVFVVEGQRPKVFQSKRGIAEYVEELASERDPLHPNVLFFDADEVPVKNADVDTTLGVEVALQWTKKADERLYSFANIVTTPDGGTHVTGLKSALTKAMNNFAYENRKLNKDKKDPDKFEARDVFAALTAAVSVKIENPQFEGQTKGRLNNGEGRTAVQTFMYQQFTDWLADKKNAKAAKDILERCLHARKVRLAQGKVSKNYNPNSIFADSGQSEKLSDVSTSSTVPVEDRELFIVEGDSAGGGAKERRDKNFQAVLPLRGKPINALTAKNSKLFDNQEIKSIIAALGGRIDQVDGENVVTLTREGRRYGKIMLAADADTDGAHIQYLVIAIIHELFPDFLREGRVFIARPPLFSIKLDGRGEKVIYAYSDEEKDQIVAKHKRSGGDVQRFKGLGEMDPEELAEAILEPDTRTLWQVSVEDAAEVAEALNLVMGSKAEPRKEWLESGGAKAALEAFTAG